MLRRILASYRRKKAYRDELKSWTQSTPDARFDRVLKKPMLGDKGKTVPLDRHYFYHPAWALRVLVENQVQAHTDISSINTFAASVSALVPTDYYELHPPKILLDNLTAHRVDLFQLPFGEGSIKSLSCMHVLEHVGLGRYGDTLDPQGDWKASRELSRVLAVGGILLIVVPVAEQSRVEFNAHRVYTYSLVMQLFEGLILKEFALIPDSPKQGGLIRHADPQLLNGQHFACGCFHFTKKEPV